MPIRKLERKFPCCGRDWIIRHADMERLWNDMTLSSNKEERIPYWNEIWPSSLALAGWLAEMQEDIRRKNCLDLGCGLGFTALVSRWLGAQVTGMDYEKDAIQYAAQNEFLNGICGINWTIGNWDSPPFPAETFDRIWAGDIMYEESFAVPIAKCLAFLLKKNGRAWLAEPGRDIFHFLPDAVSNFGLSIRRICSLPVFSLTPQEIPVPVPVSIWELSKKIVL